MYNFLLAALFVIQLVQANANLPAPYDLQTEYLPSKYALALSTFYKPRFSWKVPLLGRHENRGEDQAAYRIIVWKKSDSDNDDDKNIIWDSAIVTSNETNLVEYDGDMKLLTPDTSFAWTVQYFYAGGIKAHNESSSLVPSQLSNISSFDIGLVTSNDWESAKWVGDESNRILRVKIPTPEASIITRARVYIAAPGCAVLSVNGNTHPYSALGNCPWTNFLKTIYYQAYDVLNMLDLTNDTQTFTFMLGHGMYIHYGPAGITPTVKAKITLTLSDGRRTTCVTNTKINNKNCFWHSTEGTYISDDPFDGTEIDWNRLPSADDWKPVPLTLQPPSKDVMIKGMAMPPTIDHHVYKPISVNYLKHEYGGPVYVYNIGKNIVGTCSIKITKPRRKQSLKINEGFFDDATITLRMGESLLSNGSLLVNYSGHSTGVKANFQRDVHHLPQHMNKSSRALRSHFAWYGFQYIAVEVSKVAEMYFNASDLGSIECYQQYPDFQITGNFHATDDRMSDNSGSKLNALQKIITTSQLGNLANYAPTDCPTREKHYWLGDSLSVAEEAMINYHVPTLFNNFLNIIADEQGHNLQYEWDLPGVVPHKTPTSSMANTMLSLGITDISWTAAFPIIMNWMHRHYGDRQIVKDLYPNAKRYMDGLSNQSTHLLNSSLPSFFIWGDWCSNQSRSVATPATGPPAAGLNYIVALDAMVEMALLLNKEDDADKYKQMSHALRITWAKTYYNASHGVYGYEAEDGYVLQTLTAGSFSLGDIVPGGVSYDDVVQKYQHDIVNVRKNHITFGSVGAKYVFQETSRTKNGHEIALNLAIQDTFPSFGYWIKQGATSCWEDWSGVADATHPPQPTHNHIFLCGGIGEWLYTNVAGITLPIDAAYATILIAPRILSTIGPASVMSSFNSPYGMIETNWTRYVTSSTNGDDRRGTTSSIDKIYMNVRLPKPGLVTFPLIDENGRFLFGSNIQILESNKVIWRKEHFIAGVPGIFDVEYNQKDHTLIVSCARGIYNFALTFH